ncbi:MAG: AI-2E family transporter [Bacteroidetes bacterium]|nr:AI-2E family transporter [Bacteroidota bacterium]
MERLFEKPFTIDRTVRLGIIALICWGLVLLIDRLSGVLLPFVLALLLAYLLDPVVNWIQKRVRNKRGIALTITFLIILIITAGFYAILIPSVIHEIKGFQEIFELHKDGVFSGSFIPEHIRIKLQEFFRSDQFKSFLTWDSLSPMVQNALPGLWASVSNVFGILASMIGLIAVWLYLIFILKDFKAFKDNWHTYLPDKIRDKTVEFVDDFNSNMMAYFRQKTIIVIINIILFGIAFNIIGLPLATLLAIMVGLMNYIPYLQNLGLIPCLLSAGLLSLETGQPYWIPVVMVIAVFLAIQLLEDAVLVPVLMKEVTGMNPAIMLLSIAIWGSLLGILGMIIALPISSLIVTYYKRYILTSSATPVPKA